MTIPLAHHSFDGSQPDPTAPIAALFDEHCDFVCRALQHYGVDDEALDDAVQDVFVTAYRRWSSFEGRSSARSWLYGIARRIAFRYRRSASARARRFVTSDEPFEGVDEPFARAHAAHSLAALLQRIDRDKRSVFVLSELEGMTASEVADALQIPVGTVYSRLRAAWQGLGREAGRERRRLRRELPSLHPPAPSPERRRRMWAMIASGLGPLSAAPVATSVGWLAQVKWVVIGAALGAGMVGARFAMVDPPTEGPHAAANPEDGVDRPSGGLDTPDPHLRHPSEGLDTPDPHLRHPSEGLDKPDPVQGRPSGGLDKPDPHPRHPSGGLDKPNPVQGRPSGGLDKPDPVQGRPSEGLPSPDPNDLAVELALIRDAKRALRDGRAADALSLLDRHARRFPQGQLADERRTARLAALCAAGRLDEAARQAMALGRDPSTACSS